MRSGGMNKNERRITCKRGERNQSKRDGIGNKNKDGGENWEERKREWVGGPRQNQGWRRSECFDLYKATQLGLAGVFRSLLADLRLRLIGLGFT